MATKQFNTRIQHKIDTWKNWSKAENFKPLLGEIIVYTTDENGNENVKIKIGDGNTVVHSLPFAVGGSATDEPGLAQIQSDWAQTDSTQPDYIKNKIGDYQKDLREFNDITFGNYAGTTPFYMWNNVLSNIDTLKDLDEEVILNVYQNGNLIDSQKFLLNPTLDSSFLSSSETGYWVLINATKTTEEILGGSAWEKKNPDYSTFNMGFIKNDTTGIVYVIAGAPNDELVGQSFLFELDFTNTTKQLIKLPWEVISNKPGDVSISESYYDTFNLASYDEYNELDGLYAFLYQKYKPFTKNVANIFLKNKIDGNITEFNNCEISSFELEGAFLYEILINTTTSFMDFAVAEGAISFEKIDNTLPSLLIVCVKEGQMTQIICDISDYANYEIEIFEIKETIISLPDSTLSEEFLNIDGKLHLAYGKPQTETIENDTEASLTLGTPLQQQGNPFLMWRNIYTIENYPYDLLKDKVQISYINSNNEQIIFDKERNPLLLELNSTLDQAFNIGTNYLGHWGIFNSKQTIMELFGQLQSGGNIVLEKYEENEPAVIVVLSQNQEDKNIYITLVSLENIHEIYSNNFIINILNEQINETILKLPKEALPDDISAEVEMVQSDYAENDETKDSYIQNRPFYDARRISHYSQEQNPNPPLINNDSLNFTLHKVSDLIPTRDEIFNCTKAIVNNIGYTFNESAIQLETDDFIIALDNESENVFCFINKSGIINFTYSDMDFSLEVPEPGIYFQTSLNGTIETGTTIEFIIGTEFKTLDIKYLPENMAFGYEEKVFEDIIWDGDITGLPEVSIELMSGSVNIKYYKVSDKILTKSVVVGAQLGIYSDTNPDDVEYGTIREEDLTDGASNNSFTYSTPIFFCIMEDNTTVDLSNTIDGFIINFPTSGTWFGKLTSNNVTTVIKYLMSRSNVIKTIDSKFLDIDNVLNDKAPLIHYHPASDIISGTLSISYGGTGFSSITDTTYITERYRASSLNASEKNPTTNGTIAWVYE